MAYYKFKTSVGEHILVRGEEFIVRKVENIADFQKIEAVGVSELTRGQIFIFRTDLETPESLRKLNPAETNFIPDDSANAIKTIVFLENAIRGSYGFLEDDDDVSREGDSGCGREDGRKGHIFVADRCAIDPLPYQFEPFFRSMRLPRPRFLIADAVGLGKTIEIGIILSEMIHRGRGQRILVCTMKSILTQFQEDIWNRFAIPLTRLDSLGVERIRQDIPLGANPFNYVDKVIVSIDTLKQKNSFQHFLENTFWDIVVIDEIHTAANRNSQRGRLVKMLSEHCESMIFASATPHNGRAESFAGIMSMLEPIIVPLGWDYRIDNKSAEERQKYERVVDNWRSYFVKRSKKDVQDSAGESFPERRILRLEFTLNDSEVAFLKLQQRMKSLCLADSDKNSGARYSELFPITVFKGFLSSPAAAMKTLQKRLGELESRNAASHGVFEEIMNVRLLQDYIRDECGVANRARDSRYQCFLNRLRELKWDGSMRCDRIVVFTERRETQDYLREAVIADFGLDPAGDVTGGKAGRQKGRGKTAAGSDSETGCAAVRILHGGMDDISQQELVEDFSLQNSPIRMLIATDAGSLGINLHFFCHIMINYDIPWSLITLEQRNGRIDRYGQKHAPEIYYLVARTSGTRIDNDTLKGSGREKSVPPGDEEQITDLRIISRLISKENEARQTLNCEAGAILALYDPKMEEEVTARSLGEGNEGFLDTNSKAAASRDDDDFLLDFLNGGSGSAAGPAEDSPDPAMSVSDMAARRISFYSDFSPEERRNTFQFYDDLFTVLKNTDGMVSRDEIVKRGTAPHEYFEVQYNSNESLKDCVIDILPREALPRDNNTCFSFSNNIGDLKKAVEKARESDRKKHAWSKFNILYAQHPVISYYITLFDSAIGRSSALSVSSNSVPEGQVWFVCHGTVPNNAGVPVINEFYVARMQFNSRSDGLCELRLLEPEPVVPLLQVLKNEGAFLKRTEKRGFFKREWLPGELDFIRENCAEACGSEAVSEYFARLRDHAEIRLGEIKEQQLEALRSWAEISRANIASSRILKGSKEKKLAEIDRTERLYREKYERDYSMKSSKSAEDISRNGNNAVPEKGYGRVKTAATTGFSGREGLSDLYIRILAVFANIRDRFGESPDPDSGVRDF